MTRCLEVWHHGSLVTSAPRGHRCGATGGNCYQNLAWGWGLGRALPPSGETAIREGQREGHGFPQDDTK